MTLYYDDNAGTSSFSLQDFEPSFGLKMNAAVREAWRESYGPVFTDRLRLRQFGAGQKISAQQARDRIAASGIALDLTPGENEYTGEQIDFLIERQRQLVMIRDVRERTPWDLGTPLRGAAMFGAGILDPLNLATAFVPWTRAFAVGQTMRAATLSAQLGTRTLGRAGVGGMDAGLSAVALEPFYFGMRQSLGDDYDAYDSMVNIAFGAAFGGGIHTIGGAGLDAFRRTMGRALPSDAYAGLSVDDIQLVEGLKAEIRSGMDARDVARVLETYTPAIRRAMGLPDADPNAVANVKSPPGLVSGGPARVKIGNDYEPAEWAVIEADQLTATVDKADNQFRDRNRAAYQAEIQARANTLDSAQVLSVDNPLMDVGPPTVALDGTIIAGNGRTLFIQRAYEIGKGGDYRNALVSRLEALGIDPAAIANMKRPVLVRRLTRQVDVKRAAMLSNEGGSSAMSPLEQAKVDAERLAGTRLSPDADGNLDTAGNRAAVRRWVDQQPEGQRNALMTEDGMLSAAGLQRLRNAVLFHAYGDSPTLARLIEATDVGSRNVAAALARTAGRVAEAEASIARGELHTLSLSADIRMAVEQFDNLRRAGTKVADYLAQQDAFGDPLTAEARLLLDALGRNIGSARRIGDVIEGYYDRLTEAGNPGQGDMFGAAAPDRLAMLQSSIDAVNSAVDTAAEVVAKVSPETREAALRVAVAQSVEGRVIDVDALIRSDEAAGATAGDREIADAAARNRRPEAVRVADFDAAAAVTERNATAPKWQSLADAEAAEADAAAMLGDTVRAGDQAFRYSRGEAPGQKKATLWQGSTARFSPEDGAPLGRFRWDFINSEGGEQAQAFGYGHYLAQQAWISQNTYRDRLVKMKAGSVGDRYTIPDGAGGVMELSARNDEATWQLPDGTLVNATQKDPRLVALADAVAQVSLSGYARARETFERLASGDEEAITAGRKDIDDFTAGGFDAGLIASMQSRLDRLVSNQKRYLDALAALDEVTAIRPLDLNEPISLNGRITGPLASGKVAGGSEFNIQKDGDGVVLFMHKAPYGFGNKGFASVDAALQFLQENNRTLAPGIQKYEPPEPIGLRERLLAADGSEVDGSLKRWIDLAVQSPLLFDAAPPPTQTLGRDLAESAAAINAKASNRTFNLSDVIDLAESGRLAGGHEFAAAAVRQARDLQARGVESITLERPGSLYRAEMDVQAFQSLMLWDEPLSAQPLAVREAFSKWGIEDAAEPEWIVRDDGFLELQVHNNTLLIKHLKAPDSLEEMASDLGYKLREVPVSQRPSYAKTEPFEITWRDGSKAWYSDVRPVLENEWLLDKYGVDAPSFAAYRNGELSTVEKTLEEAKQRALEFAGIRNLTGEDAYARLKNDIESGALNNSPALIAAAAEIARRRGMDSRGTYTSRSFPADEIASVMLHNAGIPGHAFLDGMSRRDGVGSYNIVIYSDDVAKIVDRYARQTGEIGRATDTPEGLTEALRLSFGRDTERLIEAGRIRLVAAPADIPGGPHPGDVKAATAPDGTVYVVAQNVSELEARGIVLHEVGVHVGMERMLGADVFGEVLTQLDDAIARGESWAQAARAAVPADTPQAYVREEQLAYLVQNAPDLPIVQRILAAVRAWAYKNFEFARERMTLTEADFRAMAVSALHHAARRSETVGEGVLVYSRGPIPDPGTAADELKHYDAAVKRATTYAKVLRAAADKLDNDAQATAAMRAAMPDITMQEIDDLLAGLRSQINGLRGMARSAKSLLGAEDRAAALQTEAMRAADMLANNLAMAAVIEKRNATLNLNVRLKSTSFVNQFRDKGLDFEGFAALLVGSERVRQGSRVSIDAEYKGFRGEWVGGMIADLERAQLMPEFTSGAFDRDIYDALWRMGTDKPDLTGLPKQAVQLAEIVSKYQEDARNQRNRFGSWIRDLQGYITRQSHDMFKIREATDAEWIAFVKDRIDLPKMQRLGLLSETDPIASLRAMYDDFAAGVHMKPVAAEEDGAAFSSGANLARRESVSRTIYFKDGLAAFEYNERFGQGTLAESVIFGLDQAARSTALLKNLGTNPEAMLTRLMNDYEDSLAPYPERRAKFRAKRGTLMNMLAQVDGSVFIPGNVTGAKIGAFLRAWQNMAKLGGALISSFSDLAGYGAELRYAQGKGMLSGVADGMGALVRGRAKDERLAITSSLGVFHESIAGSVMARFDSPDLMGGKMAAAVQLFFRLNGLTWWTETLRDGAALAHSHYMAVQAGRAFDAIDPELRRMLGLYNIDAGKWDLLRMGQLQQADGRMYLTPDGLRTVPRAAYENYILQVGRTVNDATVSNLQDDLAQALRVMAIDRAHHAVLEPSARTRAWMLRGTRPGTVPGEILRYIGQFKSFSVAMVHSVLGREVYGRGYDTLGEYLRKGHGDMLGLAYMIGLFGLIGYGAMTAKDLLRGREPRDPLDPRTMMAALAQGGGLGLYGDFLFGEYSRMGRTFTASLAGPVIGNADTILDLWTRLREGDDLAASAFSSLLSNTPFMNLFWLRPLLNYLVLWHIQEALNPGALRRMEQRITRDTGQDFILPPSQVVR